jgi:hypothetical protein
MFIYRTDVLTRVGHRTYRLVYRSHKLRHRSPPVSTQSCSNPL